MLITLRGGPPISSAGAGPSARKHAGHRDRRGGKAAAGGGIPCRDQASLDCNAPPFRLVSLLMLVPKGPPPRAASRIRDERECRRRDASKHSGACQGGGWFLASKRQKPVPCPACQRLGRRPSRRAEGRYHRVPGCGWQACSPMIMMPVRCASPGSDPFSCGAMRVRFSRGQDMNPQPNPAMGHGPLPMKGCRWGGVGRDDRKWDHPAGSTRPALSGQDDAGRDYPGGAP